jgi:putative FmdB family regulatory protein
MPIYAYRCESCGHAKDVLQKVSDPLLTVCPACHAETFKKQLTAAGFQLKGSGWYVTDFKGGNGAAKGPATPAADKPADAAPKTEPSSGSSSDGSPSASSSASSTSSSDSAPSAGCGGSCACH